MPFGEILFLMLANVMWAQATFDYSLTKSFLQVKHCTMASYFYCSSKRQMVNVVKQFSDDNTRVSIYNVANRTFSVSSVLEKQHYQIGVIIDGDCSNVQEFLIECADRKYFFETYHWLMFASDESAINLFENVALSVNADVNLVVPNKHGKTLSWTIFDIYNPSQKRGGDLKVEKVGSYSSEGGYNLKLVWNKYYKRRNMTGTTFKAAMVIPEKINVTLEEYLESETEKNNNTFSRFNAVTVQICQDFFNFSMKKSIVNSWGYVQHDGDVDGLVRKLKYDELDFGIAALLYKLFRLKVIDYGYGNWEMKSVFLFRHPKTTSSSYELYFRPLTAAVWVATFVVLILMVLVLRFILTKEVKLLKFIESDGNLGENSWSFLIIYNIGEFCQQGLSYVPIFLSGRIVVFCLLLFFFLIFQFYSANIVSFLLLPPKKTITTLSDLLKSSLQVGMEDVLYDIDYIKTTTDPVAIALYKTKMTSSDNKSNFLLPPAGLEKVKAGGFAFHTQTSTSYPLVERGFEERAICELAEVQLYKPLYAHMALSKKSPLREMFMYCNVYQMELGILHRLRNRWDARKPQCVDYTPYLEVGVGLNESYWAISLLGCGIVSSLILLLLENVWKRLGIQFTILEKLKLFANRKKQTKII